MHNQLVNGNGFVQNNCLGHQRQHRPIVAAIVIVFEEILGQYRQMGALSLKSINIRQQQPQQQQKTLCLHCVRITFFFRLSLARGNVLMIAIITAICRSSSIATGHTIYILVLFWQIIKRGKTIAVVAVAPTPQPLPSIRPFVVVVRYKHTSWLFFSSLSFLFSYRIHSGK